MRLNWSSGVILAAAFTLSTSGASAAPMLGAPQLFAPGVISASANDGSPTFSPDGNTLFFTRSGASWGIILESHRTNGRWSQPVIAPFSGRWNDWSPELSPDGRYLVFVSVRNHRANLWRVNRIGATWSTPARLPDTVNIGASIWKPSMAANGDVYFVSIDAKGNKRLYCSQFVAGKYQTAQPLSFSDGTLGDVDPEVAPNESFMIFASNSRTVNDPKDHLFTVYRRAGIWGAPQPLHYAGDDANGTSTDNEPHFSHDLRTLYFTSDRSRKARFPRSAAQAARDLAGLNSWDNSNSNAWSVALWPLLPRR